jgi:hypothetical protein
LKRFGASFFDIGVIKMLPFGFLDAENGTVTFFNFFLDGITFVFRVYTSNVPV